MSYDIDPGAISKIVLTALPVLPNVLHLLSCGSSKAKREEIIEILAEAEDELICSLAHVGQSILGGSLFWLPS